MRLTAASRRRDRDWVGCVGRNHRSSAHLIERSIQTEDPALSNGWALVEVILKALFRVEIVPIVSEGDLLLYQRIATALLKGVGIVAVSAPPQPACHLAFRCKENALVGQQINGPGKAVSG